MKKGGAINKKTQAIIRTSGLIASVAVAIYTFLITAGALPRFDYDFSDAFGYGIGVAWLIAGILEYFFFGLTPRNIIIRVVGYHILAIIYVLGIAGFSTLPFLSCWVLLAYATYSYYLMRGAIVSVGILWILGIVDGGLRGDMSRVIDNASVATSLSIVILVTILITRSQERDEKEFEKSKQAESLQRESLQTLINNIADAVLSTDEDGTIRLYNAATIGLLDTNENLIGKTIDDTLHLRDESDEPVMMQSLLQSARGVTVNDSLRSIIGGEEIRIEVSYSPIRGSYSAEGLGSDDSGYIIILRDITKAKSLEEERDEFISVVSHELRTPLTIAEGAIDNARLVFEKDSSKTEIVDKSMNMAHEQILLLSKMVNDLSTLSRAERGTADKSEIINVKELLHELYEEYHPQAVAKGLVLNLSANEPLGFVNVSRLYLLELLQNFITNSLKYTNEGSITIAAERIEDGQIRFSVSDTGIGISKSDQAKIFEKFYRSEDYRTRETGGTGLGLYVSEKLAHKMETKITFESRLNHGSTFSFNLPLVDESPSA
jgi:PAS domain S-box-containing protein